MGKIIQLDETLSNMIAAGEVVENMASVIKELVENAIDAESTNIEIHLLESGLKSMKIIDNGIGMDEEDLIMAFKRHATSKIKTHHDLYHIASLGFRGEALPSIASVSTLTIESSVDGKTAHKIIFKAGECIARESGALKKGTSVTVESLFYNTPARLKHLKSEQKELAYIVDYVNKMALAHPSIRFTLTNNNKIMFKSTGDSQVLKVLHEIYSLDIIKQMVPFESQDQYFKINGYLTKPAYNRSSRQHMTIITNHRMIKNNRLMQAIQEGYRTYLPQHKYPIIFLNIEVDPLLIDVNIHPQKLEVKFTEQHHLERLIKETVYKTLSRENLIPDIKEDKPRPIVQERMVFNTTRNHETHENDDETINHDFEYKNNYSNEVYDSTQSKSDETDTEDLTMIKPLKESHKRFPELDYIGQHHGTYLICQSYEGLYLIDQHAAAERIRYEKYYDAMRKDNQTRHQLMIPIEVNLSNQELVALDEELNTLKELGLTIRKKSAQTIEILEIPDWFMKGDEEDYAERMIKHILNDQALSIGLIIDQLAKDLSCKHSIKANHFINKNEIDVLLKDLEQAKNPFTCPHGRPTVIKFSVAEIEKMFKRIQS